MEQRCEYPTVCERCRCSLSFVNGNAFNSKLLVCTNVKCLECYGEYYVYCKGEHDIITKLS